MARHERDGGARPPKGRAPGAPVETLGERALVDFGTQRLNMVESQVRPSDITDRRLMRVLLDLPRELFLPAANRSVAYADEDVPASQSAGGRAVRYLVAPRTLATMIQAMELSQEKVFAYLALSAATINRKIKREERLSPDESARVHRSMGEIMRACVDAGGSITGEHGVGLDKIGYIEMIFSPDSLRAMCRLREVFDPDHRSNPGKVVPIHSCQEWRATPSGRASEETSGLAQAGSK